MEQEQFNFSEEVVNKLRKVNNLISDEENKLNTLLSGIHTLLYPPRNGQLKINVHNVSTNLDKPIKQDGRRLKYDIVIKLFSNDEACNLRSHVNEGFPFYTFQTNKFDSDAVYNYKEDLLEEPNLDFGFKWKEHDAQGKFLKDEKYCDLMFHLLTYCPISWFDMASINNVKLTLLMEVEIK